MDIQIKSDMEPEDVIESFISKLTLSELNCRDVCHFGNMDDCVKISKYIHSKLEIFINPMHSYWLWSTFSSGVNANWIIVDERNLKWFFETLKEPRYYL